MFCWLHSNKGNFGRRIKNWISVFQKISYEVKLLILFILIEGVLDVEQKSLAFKETFIKRISIYFLNFIKLFFIKIFSCKATTYWRKCRLYVFKELKSHNFNFLLSCNLSFNSSLANIIIKNFNWRNLVML